MPHMLLLATPEIPAPLATQPVLAPKLPKTAATPPWPLASRTLPVPRLVPPVRPRPGPSPVVAGRSHGARLGPHCCQQWKLWCLALPSVDLLVQSGASPNPLVTSPSVENVHLIPHRERWAIDSSHLNQRLNVAYYPTLLDFWHTLHCVPRCFLVLLSNHYQAWSCAVHLDLPGVVPQPLAHAPSAIVLRPMLSTPFRCEVLARTPSADPPYSHPEVSGRLRLRILWLRQCCFSALLLGGCLV